LFVGWLFQGALRSNSTPDRKKKILKLEEVWAGVGLGLYPHSHGRSVLSEVRLEVGISSYCLFLY
jgi:hypothetical protein